MGKGEFKNRIKGLMCIVLAITVFMTLGGIQTYAEGLVEISMYSDTIFWNNGDGERLYTGDRINIGTGGMFRITNEPEGMTIVKGSWSYGGNNYYQDVQLGTVEQKIGQKYVLDLQDSTKYRIIGSISDELIETGGGAVFDYNDGSQKLYEFELFYRPFRAQYTGGEAHSEVIFSEDVVVDGTDVYFVLPSNMDASGHYYGPEVKLNGWYKRTDAGLSEELLSPGAKVAATDDMSFEADVTTEENNKLSSGRTYQLQQGTAYVLEAGGTIDGDTTEYAAGITVYPASSGSYTFK